MLIGQVDRKMLGSHSPFYCPGEPLSDRLIGQVRFDLLRMYGLRRWIEKEHEVPFESRVHSRLADASYENSDIVSSTLSIRFGDEAIADLFGVLAIAHSRGDVLWAHHVGQAV